MRNLEPLSPDALLGLMAAFRDDPRQEKFDLGVGIYRNEDGATPVMEAVKKAEFELLETEHTKAYEGPRGNADFCESIEFLLLGNQRLGLGNRIASVATPGGCGAIYLGVSLAARVQPDAVVWVSQPSWPNHAKIARGIGLRVNHYPYLNEAGNTVDIDTLIDGLAAAKAGDLVIVQGPCHNPTGLDFPAAAWRRFAEFANSRNLQVLIDIAYHGLGVGLEEDIEGVRDCVRTLKQALIAYSCSKNFGLYRERTGCLIAITESPEVSVSVLSHLADISRVSYSMPPAHSPAIVNTILRNQALRRLWELELSSMRERLTGLRAALLAPILDSIDMKNRASFTPKGMFLQLSLTHDAVAALRTQNGIYVPTSGRINVAGLNRSNARQIGEILAKNISAHSA